MIKWIKFLPKTNAIALVFSPELTNCEIDWVMFHIEK